MWLVWQGGWRGRCGRGWCGRGWALDWMGISLSSPRGSDPWTCRSGPWARLHYRTTGRPSGAEVRTGALELPVQGATGRPRVALVRGCHCLLRTSLGGGCACLPVEFPALCLVVRQLSGLERPGLGPCCALEAGPVDGSLQDRQTCSPVPGTAALGPPS